MFIGKTVQFTGVKMVNGRKDYPAIIIDDFGANDFGAFNLMVFDTDGPRVEFSVPYHGGVHPTDGPYWELSETAG